MGSRSIEQHPADVRVSEALGGALEDSGMSLRELSRRSGVRLTRLGDVLRRGRAMTVGELEAIAGTLGLDPVEVLREAQERARERERAQVVQLGERRPDWPEELPPEWELAAQIQPGADEELAETTGWRDDLGEESQDIPYEED
ncbi:helix-turn-helix domain-containing protein [Actinomyces qiguomingii]|uniref:helix-turn-helix domain-containing protein n=1 Tax=Actinomyces qiguomingii TaxID=2057800 RepID=UPI000CA05049|nr:helix-turn-helix transcriptional regulator [Actinomyces qiguomingii]